MPNTIANLITDHDPKSPAIGAPNRSWLRFGDLRNLKSSVAASLHALGISHGDRVAIVLPNGLEMATAFVTIAQAATAAPLNPTYRQDDYEVYLQDLQAKVLVEAEDEDGLALAGAEKLGIPALHLSKDDAGPAGSFTLAGNTSGGEADEAAPGADDVALILHTSGSTLRPKIVPLLQSNVFASANNIRASLAHPEIVQVVCFAVPHAKLGEDIAAAAVLTDGSTLQENDIRAFAAERLAGFKVPRNVAILDAKPKGATGKIQRIGIAEMLRLTGA